MNRCEETNLCELLDALTRRKAGVEGGAAGNHDDAAPVLDGGHMVRQPAQRDAPLLVGVHILSDACNERREVRLEAQESAAGILVQCCVSRLFHRM